MVGSREDRLRMVAYMGTEDSLDMPLEDEYVLALAELPHAVSLQRAENGW